MTVSKVLVVTPNSEIKENSNFSLFEKSPLKVIYAEKINEAIFRSYGEMVVLVVIIESDSNVISQLIRGLKLDERNLPVLVSSPNELKISEALLKKKSFFQVSYPCNYEEIFSLLRKIIDSEEVLLENKQVLIVDDIENNRSLLKEYFDGAPVDIDEAENGEQALDRILSKNYDLVLLDFQMPGLNGGDVLVEIRKIYSRKKLPVIIVSAQDEIEIVKQLITLGAQDYLTKPIVLSSFYEKVGKALKIELG